MSTYVKTYATRAAFDTALASGDISTLMNGVSSSAPSVSIIAHITESGETFACGTNVMVDIEAVGVGDVVMYDSTNAKFFGIAQKWIENNYPYPPTQKIMKYSSGVLPSRYVFCGWCVKRSGKKLRLAGSPSSGIPWSNTNASDYAWTVSTINNDQYYTEKKYGGRQPVSGQGNSAYCWPSLRYQEWYHWKRAGQTAQFCPKTRDGWDAWMLANGMYDPDKTMTLDYGNTTIKPADYKYSYDRFMNTIFQPKYPATQDVFADNPGAYNTVRIVQAYIGKTNQGGTITEDTANYAAGYCYNHSVNAPGLGKHQWFLGNIAEIGEVAHLRHVWGGSWGSGYLWSSSQGSSNDAWFFSYDGGCNRFAKNGGFTTVPLADLILTT